MESPALKLIRHFEGLRLTPYRDVVGYWTVGYGHLISKDRSLALPFQKITLMQAEALLNLDYSHALTAVRRLCPVHLEDHQTAALVDFVYNLGAGALQLSTLRKKILQGELDEVPAQLMRWIYAGAVKLPGLVRRRRVEALLWQGEELSWR